MTGMTGAAARGGRAEDVNFRPLVSHNKGINRESEDVKVISLAVADKLTQALTGKSAL